MAKGFANARRWLTLEAVLESSLPRSYTRYAGQWLIVAFDTARRLLAFGLITLGVMVTKVGTAPALMRPLICRQLARSGIALLPMAAVLAGALGFALIGQTVALLTRVGVQDLVGTLMVTAIVRELGPFATALLMLMRVGVPTVVELGTARALGEVEGLEALGIDPVHLLVVPRVLGMTLSVLALTAYLVVGAIVAGYLFAFLQDVPLTPGEYFRQLALALTWEDFLLLGLKSLGFGFSISLVCCFQGLSRPLELREVSEATTTAVVASLLACVALDALFIVVYLLL
jgi:phospholipid/cholesterol/gamma-HCH transport system permease protein